MEITVRVRTVYGKEAIYPACARAELFADLTKQKTFSRHQIGLIKALGYTVKAENVQPIL